MVFFQLACEKSMFVQDACNDTYPTWFSPIHLYTLNGFWVRTMQYHRCSCLATQKQLWMYCPYLPISVLTKKVLPWNAFWMEIQSHLLWKNSKRKSFYPHFCSALQFCHVHNSNIKMQESLFFLLATDIRCTRKEAHIEVLIGIIYSQETEDVLECKLKEGSDFDFFLHAVKRTAELCWLLRDWAALSTVVLDTPQSGGGTWKGITPHFAKANLVNVVQFPGASLWMDDESQALHYYGLMSYHLSAGPHSCPSKADIHRLKPSSQLNHYLKTYSCLKLPRSFLNGLGQETGPNASGGAASTTSAGNVSEYHSWESFW